MTAALIELSYEDLYDLAPNEYGETGGVKLKAYIGDNTILEEILYDTDVPFVLRGYGNGESNGLQEWFANKLGELFKTKVASDE